MLASNPFALSLYLTSFLINGTFHFPENEVIQTIELNVNFVNVNSGYL